MRTHVPVLLSLLLCVACAFPSDGRGLGLAAGRSGRRAPGVSNVIAVAAGGARNLVLHADGTVRGA